MKHSLTAFLPCTSLKFPGQLKLKLKVFHIKKTVYRTPGYYLEVQLHGGEVIHDSILVKLSPTATCEMARLTSCYNKVLKKPPYPLRVFINTNQLTVEGL